MKIGKAEAAIGQLIDVGSLDLSAKGSSIGEAEIVGDNDEEVWSPGHVRMY